MARGIRRSQREGLNAWPGYVDALSTLLMVIIFVLLVFVLAQGFLSVTLSSRDRALDRLNRQVAELADLLSLERSQTDELRASLGRAQDEARRAATARDAAQGELTGLRTERDQLHDERDTLRDARDQLAARLSDAELAARGTGERIASLESRLTEALGRAEAVGGQTAEAVRQRAEAARALGAAQAGRQQAEQSLTEAQARLAALQAQAATLADQVRALTALRDQLEKQAQDAQAKLGEEQRAHGEAVRLSESAQAQAALLARQIDDLKAQLQRLSAALDVQQKAGQEKDAQIADLGTRLNAALAAKVEELQRYRSDFFGRLREVLGDRPDVRIVGDRFVFQSEVLFPVGGADLSDSGKAQIRQIAGVLKDISTRIPPDTPWILRVDGHADRTPFRGGGRFASNWELSAARAIAVAQLLIGEGLPASRVAAAAFGDNQPIDQGDSPEALARNRRIELRLTDR
ncbi:peptidoglycan -binding protein [Roseomonas gilardii]|uniref:Peptidoglycan -binding protein n=1 Tax=Roseomonas gilardii TaxID=257708 RepID=A0ABU3MIN2_9PROT|nr:peptidoglycan -binding protein [Roseomonas gilardii]MDT8332682.1 peptidoglycan -binding protein [Roseomonas gilardii]